MLCEIRYVNSTVNIHFCLHQLFLGLSLFGVFFSAQ